MSRLHPAKTKAAEPELDLEASTIHVHDGYRWRIIPYKGLNKYRVSKQVKKAKDLPSGTGGYIYQGDMVKDALKTLFGEDPMAASASSSWKTLKSKQKPRQVKGKRSKSVSRSKKSKRVSRRKQSKRVSRRKRSSRGKKVRKERSTGGKDHENVLCGG